jgi:hypothetical protein
MGELALRLIFCYKHLSFYICNLSFHCGPSQSMTNYKCKIINVKWKLSSLQRPAQRELITLVASFAAVVNTNDGGISVVR